MPEKTDKPSRQFFKKISTAVELGLDELIAKARTRIAQEEEDALYRKSIYKDISYQGGSQGYQDRTGRMSFQMLKYMGLKDSIASMIIMYYQNEVAAFCQESAGSYQEGFKIQVKNEEQVLQKIKEELFGKEDEKRTPETDGEDAAPVEKADDAPVQEAEGEDQGQDQPDPQDAGLNEEPDKLTDQDKERQAKDELRERTRKDIEKFTSLMLNCGRMEGRPFEARRWNFEQYARAFIRDSLTYDWAATEFIPEENSDELHYWVPVDGSTIRFSTPELKNYKNFQVNTSGYDILFPEKELKALAESDALELDEEKLAKEQYKYVQVVRGKIERAFTEAELAVGMRNPTTDIYANGYSISELELLTRIIESHLNTENYNRAYFNNGFATKGFIHIKAPLPRRKLEQVRIQWNHMVKGNRNSWQTPIFAGMEEISWVPLTQNHSDIEFSNWLNYLIKIICGLYQVDPAAIGFGMKDEGGRGGGSLSGENTKEKLSHSRSKGLRPLLKFFEAYINSNIMSRLTDKYEFKFVGLDDEDQTEALARQEKEVKFKKSVNEIREEDGLRPIPGADDLILDPSYLQWYTQFHPEGKKLMSEMQQQDMENQVMQSQFDRHSQASEQESENQAGQAENPDLQQSLSPAELRKALIQRSRKLMKARPIVVEYYLPKPKK